MYLINLKSKTIRTFITIVIDSFSLNAFGQGTSQLPWNPDENGDGVIGVSDLQGLLSQDGLEFSATCYCATHERPEVEYSIIATGADITTRSVFVSEAALEGWRLMPDADGYGYSTMWRWAE
ncbi:MAG: hypothetical protein ACKVGT_10520 [Flavobacteriales bacterium]